jgi:hypothetical protein
MTIPTLPLSALILSTVLHAGDKPFLNSLGCHFDLLSSHQRIEALSLRPRLRPLSTPVKLLQPTGPLRFGTGMVVELKTGEKVTAVSNAASATPEMIWQHLQQKYRGQTLRPLWWGLVEIQKQEDPGSPGRIVRATALPVDLNQFPRQHQKADNNVEHLVAALTAIEPNLVDPQSVRESPILRPNAPPIQLAPFLTNPRAVSEVLEPMQDILLTCLKAPNESPTSARQFLDTFAAKTEEFATYRERFSSVLQGLENDGLIGAEKRHELESLFLDMISADPKPNRYLGDALHGELSSLQEKIHYVVTNPNEHVEIIEPGTIIQATGTASPAAQ